MLSNNFPKKLLANQTHAIICITGNLLPPVENEYSWLTK